MPVPASYARESDDKDTLNCVKFNDLISFFRQKRKFSLSLFSQVPSRGLEKMKK